MSTRPTHLIPVELLLAAYRAGIFPMSDSRDDEEIFWVDPEERAIIPLDGFRCSHSLAKLIRRDRFTVTCDQAFTQVINACAAPRPDHPESWISERIAASYRELHAQGHAHSIECWQNGELVGGLYGVAFDRVFCGESMFSRADNASKVALAWLVALLRHAGCELLDCQFMTDHLQSMGAIPVSQDEYRDRLQAAREGTPAMALPQAYVAVVGSAAAAGAASGVGADDGAADAVARGAGRAALPPADGLIASSSPGKLIAQSLTQTS